MKHVMVPSIAGKTIDSLLYFIGSARAWKGSFGPLFSQLWSVKQYKVSSPVSVQESWHNYSVLQNDWSTTLTLH
jgi:hypothetical protein